MALKMLRDQLTGIFPVRMQTELFVGLLSVNGSSE